MSNADLFWTVVLCILYILLVIYRKQLDEVTDDFVSVFIGIIAVIGALVTVGITISNFNSWINSVDFSAPIDYGSNTFKFLLLIPPILSGFGVYWYLRRPLKEEEPVDTVHLSKEKRLLVTDMERHYLYHEEYKLDKSEFNILKHCS